MNIEMWWEHFNRHRIAAPSIVIDGEEEKHFEFWLRNFDGKNFYKPVTLRADTPGVYVIADRAWRERYAQSLFYGLPIYDTKQWLDEETKTHRKEWVRRETPTDLAGYVTNYGHKVTYSRTGESFLIVSTIPMNMDSVLVR